MRHALRAILIVIVAGMSPVRAGDSNPAAGISLWDTGAPFGDAISLGDRNGWKAVPGDLLLLEADPLKAASDPGYYGREYAFKGDAVVENAYMAVAFWSSRGQVAIYSKAVAGRKLVGLIPLAAKAKPMHISRCEILRNAGDEVVLNVSFTAGSEASSSAAFTFDRTPIIAVSPAQDMKGVSLSGDIDYGVAPSFIGDDLVLAPAQFASANTLHVPAESLFLGLLKGENSELVMTWPGGKQRMALNLGDDGQGRRRIESIDFDHDGQSLYLAALEAPGIWHREELKPSFLEKDVTIAWKRPFPAQWITQLDEGGVKATFAFRSVKGQIWRAAAGMYVYPVWFDGGDTLYHLSKKVAPKGESLIYCLEGSGTPASVLTPVDIMKATLGRQASDALLDPAGHRLRTHHRRAGDGVRRACTCGCTEAIQAVCDAGQEVEKGEYVSQAVDDMMYFVTRHVERIDEYRAFADDMIQFLRTTGGSSPELKPYLDNLQQIAQQIPREYDAQKDNIQSVDYANELARKTKALTARKDVQNLPTYKDLGEKWRAMGGAQDGLLGQCHVTVRKLYQEAGYGCLTSPKAAEVAKEIRRRCRLCLRNPDGYEIWPNY